jgi:hypothetical protein
MTNCSIFRMAAFALLLSVLLNSQELRAQHVWQHTEICDDCIPETSYFRDSLYGFVRVSQPDIFADHRNFLTTDGGSSWQEQTTLRFWHYKQSFHDIDVNSDGDIYIYSDNDLPSLLTIPLEGESHGVNLWYLPIELDMLDSMNGKYIGITKSTRGVNFCTTTNGGENWYSIYDDQIVAGYTLEDARLIEGGAIVAYQRGDTIIMERTTDSARTWISDTAYVNTIGRAPYAGPLSLSANGALLILQKKDTLDYISTSDNGKSWQQYNVTGGRMHRIYEPSPGNLWAIVGRTYANTLPHIPSLLGQKNGHVFMADTLYYSTNSGASWDKDITFANDTIADMHWPDGQHGFVISYRDNKVKVSRLAPQLAVREERESEGIRVWPNPSSDRVFTIEGRISGGCTIKVTDVTGRTIRNEQTELEPGDSHRLKLSPELPAGVYYLRIRSGITSYFAKLIVK